MVGWIRLAARSFAVAALIGAAQLGAAQALSMFVWTAVPTPDMWRRQLTWLVFVFAAAVLGGVAGGRRSVRSIRIALNNRRVLAAQRRHSGLTLHEQGVRAASRRAVTAAKDRTVDTARGFAAGAARVSATFFAALGAATGFALVWLPARNVLDAADLRTLGLAAAIGLAVGSVISLLSLAAAPIAANAGTAVIWIWLFGLTSLGLALATGRNTQTPRLGVLDAPYLIGPDDWWLGPNLMVAVAALFGVGVAAAARWIGAHRLGVAVSGLAGPSLVAAGYLLVGPEGETGSGYVASLLAACVGLLTSAGTAAAQRGEAEPPQPPSTTAALPAGASAAYPAALPGATRAPRAIEGARTPVSTKLAPGYASSEPLYLAPARSAPIHPAPVAPPAPRRRAGLGKKGSAPAVPAPAAAAAADAAAWPGGLPDPYTAPPRPAAQKPAPQKPAPQKPAPQKPAPQKPAPQPARPVPPPKPATQKATQQPTPQPAPPVPPPKPTPQAAPAQPAPLPVAPPAPDPSPAKKPRGRRAKRAAVVAQVVAPEPVAAVDSVPRTARPAEVVAVQSSEKAARSSKKAAQSSEKAAQSSTKAPQSSEKPANGSGSESRGRLARRRAARLAERRAAEEAAAAAREERLRRRAKALDKREKEHVDWVQNLVNLPADPTLTTRRK